MSQQSFLQTTATGSDINFTITTFSSDEILVYVDGVKKDAGVHYNINPYNSNGQSTVDWIGTAPSSPSVVRVVRQTDVLNNGNTAVEGKATYQAGASVKADDLNNNQKQVLRALQEHNDQLIQTYDLEDGAVNSAKIKDASIVEGDLANSAVTSNKIADNAVTTTEILNGAVTRAKLEADIIDGTKLADNAVDSEHYTDGSIDRVHLEADIIDSTKLADNAVNSEHYVDGSIDREHLSADIIDSTKLADNSVGAEHIQAGTITGTEISTGTLDSRYYTKAQSDAAYFNVSTGDTIKDGDTFPDNDTTIATTAAINDRIIDLIDDVGGFVPIANETSFPTSNPDVNGNAGTIVSVSAASTNLVPSGTTVTIANGRGSGLAVIITGVSATIPSGFGFLVETTSIDHTYTFHRLSPNATEVTAVAGRATEIARLGTADAVADMAILGTADVVADLNTLGTADVVSDMNTLGTADVVADMNTLAVTSVVNNMDTVAGAVTNVNNVGNSITNVNNVAGALTNIGNVAGALTNVNNVGGSITNVNNVGNSISNVNTVASNLGTVNDFAARYSSGANNPTTNLDTGDLFFNTTSSSLKVYTGNAWVDGVTTTGNFALKTGNTFTGSNRYNDSAKAEFGTSADLEIFHSGSNSFIKQVGTGDLFLQCDNGEIIYLRPKANEDGVKIINDGAVELYYDNSKKFESKSTGVQVTGDVDATGVLRAKDIALTDVSPAVNFIDSDDSRQYRINSQSSKFNFTDVTNNIDRLVINSDGHIDIAGNLDVGAGIDVTGNITVSGTVDGVDIAALNTTVGNITTDVVSDTSPQLGGDLDTNGNNISFDDNDQLRFGNATGGDIVIKHTTSDNNGHIENHTGDLLISTKGAGDDVIIEAVDDIELKPKGGEDGIKVIGDGAVELYHDGSKKFETYSGGVRLHGELLMQSNHFYINDNAKLRIGSGQDLEIFHDGSDSFIKDVGTGKLNIVGDNDVDIKSTGGELKARFITNGAVELYHNNTKRFETTAGGTIITGSLGTTDTITSGAHIKTGTDTGKLMVGTSNDLQIHHDGTRNIIDSATSTPLSFRYGGSEQFFISNAEFKGGDNKKIKLGTGDDLQIYHDGSHSRIVHNGTGTSELLLAGDIVSLNSGNQAEYMLKGTANGSVELYYDNSKKFETGATHSYVYSANNGNHGGLIVRNTNSNNGSRAELRLEAQNNASFATIFCDHVNQNLRLGYNSTGTTIDIFGNGNMFTGSVIPNANNSKDLGSTSFRWANVYTNDLNLSNEGSKNDVDGTWGDWTIQEGESNLFLKNNRSGKKYKFNLTEVS